MTSEQAPAAAEPQANPRSKLPFIVVALLMAIEGVAIFAVTKFFISTPAVVHGEGLDARPAFDDPRKAIDSQPTAEVEITECRPSNSVTGKLLTFKLRVSALVLRSDMERATELVGVNEARLTDRVNFVIRSAEPHHLSEPGLETIKRRFKHEIDGILGDPALIKEVLVPEMLQSGPGL